MEQEDVKAKYVEEFKTTDKSIHDPIERLDYLKTQIRRVLYTLKNNPSFLQWMLEHQDSDERKVMIVEYATNRAIRRKDVLAYVVCIKTGRSNVMNMIVNDENKEKRLQQTNEVLCDLETAFVTLCFLRMESFTAITDDRMKAIATLVLCISNKEKRLRNELFGWVGGGGGGKLTQTIDEHKKIIDELTCCLMNHTIDRMFWKVDIVTCLFDIINS